MAADIAYYLSMPSPPTYTRYAVAEGPAWPVYGRIGSGQPVSIQSFTDPAAHPGYVVVQLETPKRQSTAADNAYSGAMSDIRQGFGRTFSRLPEVFGVSRQTLYNWLGGEMPNVRHHARILQLAEAARAFSEASFKPDATSLMRTLARGKSFLELMSVSADGRDTALKLIALTQRSRAARANIDAALAGVEPSNTVRMTIGAPALSEDPG